MSTTRSAPSGDTTSVEAQIAALESLGLKLSSKDGDADMVELEIEAGRPVLVGWLHAGNMLRGEPPMCNGLGCGHWSVISGYAGKNSNDPEWIMQDPRGYLKWRRVVTAIRIWDVMSV